MIVITTTTVCLAKKVQQFDALSFQVNNRTINCGQKDNAKLSSRNYSLVNGLGEMDFKPHYVNKENLMLKDSTM